MLVAAVAAELIVRQVTGQPHLREVVAVTLITLVSANLSMVPLAIVRKGSTVAIFQAGFGGTVLHLFLTIGMGAAAHAMRLVGERSLFVFLLLGFYWISLMLVVVAMIRVFRRSSAAAAANQVPASQTAPTMR
jgi:hypothetical protein